MAYDVYVKFRKSRDYSNEFKDRIIHLLPGPYKVPREMLNDMDNNGVHCFSFDNEEPARNFAKSIFGSLNKTFDTQTSFLIDYNLGSDLSFT